MFSVSDMLSLGGMVVFGLRGGGRVGVGYGGRFELDWGWVQM